VLIALHLPSAWHEPTQRGAARSSHTSSCDFLRVPHLHHF
jgi:hypothetical protein